MYSNGISRWLKIKDVKKLRQDIENDPLIKDQMFNLGCLLVYSIGDYLAPVLVGVHTINNLDRDDEQENEGYESDKIIKITSPEPEIIIKDVLPMFVRCCVSGFKW